jgi:hypothetical protein
VAARESSLLPPSGSKAGKVDCWWGILPLHAFQGCASGCCRPFVSLSWLTKGSPPLLMPKVLAALAKSGERPLACLEIAKVEGDSCLAGWRYRKRDQVET